jgi:hypothetical protein
VCGATFGAFSDEPDELDPQFHDCFRSMPLHDVLEFAVAVGGPETRAKLEPLLESLRPA